jgi:AraC-like DNA-binding protein
MPHSNRLDRLSALLDGLAPRVEVMPSAAGTSRLTLAARPERMLYLHLVARGGVQLHLPHAAAQTLATPSIVICRADQAHALTPLDDTVFETLVCAQAFLAGPAAPLLLAEFAQALVVPLAGADTALQHVIGLMCAEMSAPRCGQSALLDRAGDILFIGLLRHLVAQPRTESGLFNGLADPRLARTLVAMHTTPQADWTLNTLAHHAGMSRTSFATHFRDTMCSPPGKYLSNLRLLIAQRAVASGHGLKRAAQDAGYGNVSALSRALSRAKATGSESQFPQ